MEQKLAKFVKIAFGLAFDIEKTTERKSGFKPALGDVDFGTGIALFGDLRLDGFAALLHLGFAKHLVVVGGTAGVYQNEVPIVNEAAVIREMLVHDYGIDPTHVSSIASDSNTGGNIAAIRARMESEMLDCGQCAVMSNLYHLPRVSLDLAAANMPIQIYPAETFWLLEDKNRKNELIERFGGGPLAERMAEEIQGVADKLRGTYKARTNTAANI